ncbi:AAA family ATPase [Rhodococcus sp. BGS-1C]|jgi:chromosome partitioning protein|uniref:ParA family protein n=1 Tax=unclassified Rhodococcus (in: high G+C Gram-positive bacteria) TaxID=192944 RepID=UPI00095913E9|nr:MULTISPECIES: AAA family ATPase [unclassified Rhodococcus (in: high G+C Gram-positive bacteria)]MCC8928537.1 AAA family ATPase [Rhodococcus sp. I2R]OLT33566.1 chromosome partitioning protein [Rhodococcus sp. CUA-806]
MATVIATINLKGGVGKTTTTAALAEFMSAEFGYKVLLVDLDPQTNLTTMMIGEQRWQEVNDRKQTVDALFASALDADLPEFDVDRSLVRGVSPLESVRGIDLLASSLDLMETQEEMNAWQYEVPGSLEPLLVLRAALANVRSNYDFILLDCAPNLGIVTANGLMMADAYVVPAIPDVLSTYGIPQLQRRVQRFTDRTGHTLTPLGLIITKYRGSSSLHRTTIERLQRAVFEYDALPAHERASRPRPPTVIPHWIPESNQIAQSADFVDFGTLRQKYGTHGQFETLRNVTDHLVQNVGVYL